MVSIFCSFSRFGESCFLFSSSVSFVGGANNAFSKPYIISIINVISHDFTLLREACHRPINYYLIIEISLLTDVLSFERSS